MSLHPSVAAVRQGVRRVLDAEALTPGDRVVVACSGGADSLALLAATVQQARSRQLLVVGAVVDHGLQQGSAEHTARVVEQMAALGAGHTVSARVEVDPGGLGIEAAARRARYGVLEQMADHFAAALVLLGHTRDDQAETVLLGLARGSGGRSLAGMRRSFDRFRRPLLDVARDDTVTACQVEGIAYWDDPHNEDEGFARVRVRRRVLPVLEEQLGPGIAATLARTADQVRTDVDFLDDLAETVHAELVAASPSAGGPPHALPVDALGSLATAVRRRVLRLLALAAGSPASELFHEHVVALDGLVTAWRGQKWIDLPGHLRGVRADGLLRIERARSQDQPQDQPQD